MGDWINVGDQVPEEDGYYLTWSSEHPGEGSIRRGWWNSTRPKGWGFSRIVTHWTKLPEPPNG